MKSQTTQELAMPYGAFELKRSYQRNLGLGLIIAALIHITIIGGVLLYSFLTTRPVQATRVMTIKSIADLGTPPPISETQKAQIAVAQPSVAAAPKVGIPKAVPDEEAPPEVTIATQAELGRISDMRASDVLGSGGGGDSIAIEIPENEYLPSADEFIPTDELPAQINPVKPIYPELARRAQMEGVVWIKALVDKHGKVRNAIIVKPSGVNAGFEEASIEAAYKINYKPANSNGQPIAVWVVYKVEFTLK